MKLTVWASIFGIPAMSLTYSLSPARHRVQQTVNKPLIDMLPSIQNPLFSCSSVDFIIFQIGKSRV